jgi:cytochrome P450
MALAEKTWEIGHNTAPYPPQIRGLPFLGIAHKLGNDPLGYFLKLYHQHGSIFRTKMLNRPLTVMAGLEANRFLNSDGNHILSSETLFSSFGREFNTDIYLTAMDGEHHMHLRKLSRRGYSRSSMVPHMATLLKIVDDYTRTLRPGDRIQVMPILQFLVTQQLGVIVANRAPDDYFPDLQRFLKFNLQVKVLRLWPGIMMQHPDYKRSKARVIELGREVLAAHRAKDDLSDDERDLIDDLLAARDLKGVPYDDNMLLAATVGPYFAGIDTVAASLSFFVYAVLKHANVMNASTDEADALFKDDVPAMQNMHKMEMLHGAAIETLRMYPVAPFTPRVATEPFEFKGYRVDKDSEIFFAQTITHYLPEFYPDPYTFDPTRFAKGQGKGTAGAFAPYTLGEHLCLGAGIAEAQMMLIMARLLRNLRLELESPDYQVKIHATPLPNPGRDFYVRVVENRMG